LDHKLAWHDQPEPMRPASHIHYEMAEGRATNCGGIGAIHLMAQKLGLIDEIDARLDLLKRHLPYMRAINVLSPAYNQAFLDGLGSEWVARFFGQGAKKWGRVL
jgi:hypothetical protein